MYILYSPKLGGWFSKSSNYTSDYREAKQFPREEALFFCLPHKSSDGFGMIPVSLDDLEAI